MLSPVIWTTVATGVEPSRHGILDFLVQDVGGGASQPVTSVQRRAPTVWELLSRAGVDVGVTSWWASWPADPVRGYLVSDRIAYQLFGFRADPEDAQGKTWPPELYERIRPLIVEPDGIGWDEVTPYLGGARRAEGDFDEQELAELLRRVRRALKPGGVVAVWDLARPSHGAQPDLVAEAFSLMFFLSSASACRTAEAHLQHLVGAGFGEGEIHPRTSPTHVLVTARKTAQNQT